MKFEIMFRMLNILLSKRKITAQEIADRYEVSVRTIYRYVEELIICGIPLNVTPGRYGGITIADTYRFPMGYLTKDEYAATLNALDAMTSQVKDENIISARDKIASTQKQEKRDLSICGNILIDGAGWGDSGRFSEKMRVCEQAVNNSESIMIDYISREGVHSKRVIDPHVLILKQNIWYIYAFCHTKQKFLTFKIARIRQATFTGKTFVKKEIRREDMDLNFFYSAENQIFVTLEIDTEQLPDVEEWLGVENIEPRGKGYIANMTLPDDNGLVGKILSFGGAVRVVEPASLKERVRLAAQKIAEQYN